MRHIILDLSVTHSQVVLKYTYARTIQPNYKHRLMALLLLAFIFFLPAGIANMTPIVVARLPLLRNWNAPLDFGKKYRGIRVLGPNKTVRGVVCGVIAGTIAGIALYASLFRLSDPWPLIAMAAAMSFGALLGDAAESFIKRQRRIPAGRVWFPFDQLDYIIGGLLFVLPFGVPPLRIVLATIALFFGLHLLVSYVGYKLKLKDRPI